MAASPEEGAIQMGLARQDLVFDGIRVKYIDIHPTEPRALLSLYNGGVLVVDLNTFQPLARYNIGSSRPSRCARFLPAQGRIVCASDDFSIYIIDENTHQEVGHFEAHRDYVRRVLPHPTLPLLFTCGDDGITSVWNVDKPFDRIESFSEHEHYVMWVAIDPRDPRCFATASLDGTIKTWRMGEQKSTFTFKGHGSQTNRKNAMVNVVEYHPTEKWLISGGDDWTVRVWDNCGKCGNLGKQLHMLVCDQQVTTIGFHSTLNLLVAGTEAGTMYFWDAHSFLPRGTSSSHVSTETYATAESATQAVHLQRHPGQPLRMFRQPIMVAGAERMKARVWAMAVDPASGALLLGHDAGVTRAEVLEAGEARKAEEASLVATSAVGAAAGKIVKIPPPARADLPPSYEATIAPAPPALVAGNSAAAPVPLDREPEWTLVSHPTHGDDDLPPPGIDDGDYDEQPLLSSVSSAPMVVREFPSFPVIGAAPVGPTARRPRRVTWLARFVCGSFFFVVFVLLIGFLIWKYGGANLPDDASNSVPERQQPVGKNGL